MKNKKIMSIVSYSWNNSTNTMTDNFMDFSTPIFIQSISNRSYPAEDFRNTMKIREVCTKSHELGYDNDLCTGSIHVLVSICVTEASDTPVPGLLCIWVFRQICPRVAHTHIYLLLHGGNSVNSFRFLTQKLNIKAVLPSLQFFLTRQKCTRSFTYFIIQVKVNICTPKYCNYLQLFNTGI